MKRRKEKEKRKKRKKIKKGKNSGRVGSLDVRLSPTREWLASQTSRGPAVTGYYRYEHRPSNSPSTLYTERPLIGIGTPLIL